MTPAVRLALALLLLVPLTGSVATAGHARSSESWRSVKLGETAHRSRASAIYAAAIRQLATKEQRATPSPKVIYVLNGVIERAQNPLQGQSDPERPFAPTLRAELRATLRDLPPLEFVDERASVLAGPAAASPGRVVSGGVLVSLGPIRGTGARAEVGCNAWKDGKGALWLTYVVERRGKAWKVTTSGPLTIS